MKLSINLLKVLLSSLALTSSLYAQGAEYLNQEVKQLEQQLADLKDDAEDAKNKLSDKEYREEQKKITENIAEANARTQKNIAKGAKSEMYKRVLALQEQRAAYLKDLAEGKTRPFPNVVENWEYYQSQVADLTESYQQFQSTESSGDKAKLTAPMLAALQPVGQWLANARHSGSSKVIVTDEVLAEHERLQQQYQETRSAGPQGKMKLVTPSHYFTLKHVPVPIQFTGPANAEVVLYSEVGGAFPNDLSYISLKTDDKGLASTSWISKGEAVANCSILYRSTELPEKGKMSVSVKRLSLLPLEQISPVPSSTEDKLKQLKNLDQ